MFIDRGNRYDLNFAAGSYYGASLGAIACSRAAVAWGDDLEGTWTQFAANTPVITSGAKGKGLQVYETRTNSIRNNTNQGLTNGDLGSGGALSTNHVSDFAAPTQGLTLTVVGSGTESGLAYRDIRLHGTTSGAGTNKIIEQFDGNQSIAAVTNDRWIGSAFIKKIAGSFNGITALSLSVDQRNSSGTILVRTQTSLLALLDPASGAPLGKSRYVGGGTLTQATLAFVCCALYVSYSSGSAVVDITLRVAAEQLEKVTAINASPSSPIMTTTTAVTRDADIVTMPVTWANDDYLIMTGYGVPTATNSYGQDQYFAVLDDGSASNQIGMIRKASSCIAAPVASAGAIPIVATVPANVWSQNLSCTVRYQTQNSYAVFGIGSSATNESYSAGFPTGFTTLHLGCSAAGGNQFDGYIQRITLSPSDMPYMTGVGDSEIFGTGSSTTAANWWYIAVHSFTPIRVFSNQGVGGQTSTQVADRFIANKETYPGWGDPRTIYVFCMGFNNYTDPATVLADIARCVAALPAGARYLVMTVPNCDNSAPDQYFGNPGFTQIVTQINGGIIATYGARVVDNRSNWIAHYNAGDPTDTTFATVYLAVPPSLRNNGTGPHPNDAGQALEGALAYSTAAGLGWAA